MLQLIIAMLMGVLCSSDMQQKPVTYKNASTYQANSDENPLMPGENGQTPPPPRN